MELYQLKSFITIGKLEHLTKAAHALPISQAALSVQIKALEEEFGVALLVRNAKGMKLTEQGKILFDYAKETLNSADQLLEKAGRLKTSVSGSIRIGLNTDPFFLRMRALNNRLSADFPDLKIYLSSSDSLSTAEMLKNGVIDIGFAYDLHWPKEITSELLAKVEIDVTIPVALAADRKIRHWSDFTELPWIWSDHDCPFHINFQKELDKHNIKPKKVAYATDEKIVMELVKDGKGLALMRHDEAQRLEKDRHAVVWGKGRVSVPLHLAYLSERKEDLLIRHVCRVIREIWTKNSEA